MRHKIILCYCSGCQKDFNYETTNWMIPMYCGNCMKDRIKDGIIERRKDMQDRRNFVSHHYNIDGDIVKACVDRRKNND